MIRDLLIGLFGAGLLALGISGIVAVTRRAVVEPRPIAYETGGEAEVAPRLGAVAVSVRVKAASRHDAMILAAHYRTAGRVCEEAGHREAAVLLKQAADLVSPIHGSSAFPVHSIGG
jgi:hypothetical protein